ncbi:hypothetical protein GSI_07614 [Ganoderma sinense ZZ0214-1]|uniref:Uncharacterized protein n=1 Tax=Ganoderma sinense ZZ0214-1 TaxID=1077348 RepID=A0A2G8S9J4_9APHY|nr:hypothetical protein GSI_07614 [Ganoderma sinense ZZ0214-1]
MAQCPPDERSVNAQKVIRGPCYADRPLRPSIPNQHPHTQPRQCSRAPARPPAPLVLPIKHVGTFVYPRTPFPSFLDFPPSLTEEGAPAEVRFVGGFGSVLKARKGGEAVEDLSAEDDKQELLSSG